MILKPKCMKTPLVVHFIQEGFMVIQRIKKDKDFLY